MAPESRSPSISDAWFFSSLNTRQPGETKLGRFSVFVANPMPNTMESSVPTNRAVVLSSSNTNGCVPEVEHVLDQNIQKSVLSGKDYNLLNSYHLVHLRFTVGLLHFNNILFRFSVLSEKYNMKLHLLLVREDLHLPFPDANSCRLSAW